MSISYALSSVLGTAGISVKQTVFFGFQLHASNSVGQQLGLVPFSQIRKLRLKEAWAPRPPSLSVVERGLPWPGHRQSSAPLGLGIDHAQTDQITVILQL